MKTVKYYIVIAFLTNIVALAISLTFSPSPSHKITETSAIAAQVLRNVIPEAASMNLWDMLNPMVIPPLSNALAWSSSGQPLLPSPLHSIYVFVCVCGSCYKVDLMQPLRSAPKFTPTLFFIPFSFCVFYYL